MNHGHAELGELPQPRHALQFVRVVSRCQLIVQQRLQRQSRVQGFQHDRVRAEGMPPPCRRQSSSFVPSSRVPRYFCLQRPARLGIGRVSVHHWRWPKHGRGLGGRDNKHSAVTATSGTHSLSQVQLVVYWIQTPALRVEGQVRPIASFRILQAVALGLVRRDKSDAGPRQRDYGGPAGPPQFTAERRN
jgi:hypothetical protein